MTKQGYDTWFSLSKLHSIDGDRMVIEVPSKFHRDWIREHHWTTLAEVIKEVTKKNDMEIDFFVQPQQHKKAGRQAKEEKKEGREEKASSLFEKKYIFSTFVIGPSNQFAHAAAKAVADAPGRAYNPLFIYSGVGLGKTHLLNAIGHHIQSKAPRIKLAYLSSEQFTNELINRMSHQRMEEFRQKYRNMDVLLIDDIQFIAGKERTQEEFFHTFNTLYESQKQIVLTSDRQPKEIPDIEERLRSRFESGLIADIQAPDLETRIAILKKKAEFWSIRLPDDVAEFLATVMKSNIRELEGALVKLGAVSSLTSTEITQEMARNELKHLIDSREKIITHELVQKVVAASFGSTTVTANLELSAPGPRNRPTPGRRPGRTRPWPPSSSPTRTTTSPARRTRSAGRSAATSASCSSRARRRRPCSSSSSTCSPTSSPSTTSPPRRRASC